MLLATVIIQIQDRVAAPLNCENRLQGHDQSKSYADEVYAARNRNGFAGETEQLPSDFTSARTWRIGWNVPTRAANRIDRPSDAGGRAALLVICRNVTKPPP